MNDPLNTPEQRKRLQRIADKASGWGVLIYMERPGDVAFLVSIVPELRGYEIVSAAPVEGGRDYDIWKDGHMIKVNQTLKQVERFLKKYAKSDEELMANAKAWVEATFALYGIKPKPTHRGTATKN